MLLVEANIFMGYSVCLIFDLQWTLVLRKIEVSSICTKTLFFMLFGIITKFIFLYSIIQKIMKNTLVAWIDIL
jgi:hypothetical protein